MKLLHNVIEARGSLERHQNAVRLAQARLDEVDRDLAAATRRVVRLTEERHEAEERLRAAREGGAL